MYVQRRSLFNTHLLPLHLRICLSPCHLYLLYSCPGRHPLLLPPENNALTHIPAQFSHLKGEKKSFILHTLYSFPPFDFIAQVLERIVCTDYCLLKSCPFYLLATSYHGPIAPTSLPLVQSLLMSGLKARRSLQTGESISKPFPSPV